MKVAVSATGSTLESAVDPRFGRCSTLLIVETDDMSVDVVSNQNSALSGGAGIQTAQQIAHRGVRVVLTGHCGPNAHQTLSAAGIDVIVGCSGPVSEVIANFKSGLYQPAAGPDVGNHSGMASGA